MRVLQLRWLDETVWKTLWEVDNRPDEALIQEAEEKHESSKLVNVPGCEFRVVEKEAV